jgi:hypothetical protein
MRSIHKLILAAILPVVTCVSVTATDQLKILSLAPASPARFKAEERVVVKVEYELESADAVRIFARPYTGGKKTPGYRAHPSPKYEKGSGEMEGWFGFISDANVDEIRVEMRSLENKLLAEASMPVKLVWKVGEKGSTSKTDESKKKHTSK